MSTEFMTVTECCHHHHIETSFIRSLGQAGLIEITVVETQECIHLDQLPHLEQYIRWHYDLDINTEGIETIRHLLDRVRDLHRELEGLKSRLKVYE